MHLVTPHSRHKSADLSTVLALHGYKDEIYAFAWTSELGWYSGAVEDMKLAVAALVGEDEAESVHYESVSGQWLAVRALMNIQGVRFQDELIVVGVSSNA